MKKTFLLSLILLFTLTSCDELFETIKDFDNSLTETEVIAGLKEALNVGSDNAAGILSNVDGYFKDEAVKILLPSEVDVITDNLHYLDNLGSIPGLSILGKDHFLNQIAELGGSEYVQGLINDLILSINRSAEDAAKEVAPIFKGAVTNMTIADGFTILRGENDEATQYLKRNTFDELVGLYSPKINSSLSKNFVGNMSAMQIWDQLTGLWNQLDSYSSLLSYISGFEYNTVDTELDTFLTEKALDGLFLKLGDEEELIRTDPVARVTEILERVFGYEE